MRWAFNGFFCCFSLPSFQRKAAEFSGSHIKKHKILHFRPLACSYPQKILFILTECTPRPEKKCNCSPPFFGIYENGVHILSKRKENENERIAPLLLTATAVPYRKKEHAPLSEGKEPNRKDCRLHQTGLWPSSVAGLSCVRMIYLF